MNLVDRLSYYPNTSAEVVFKKFSSQEVLPTQRFYDSSTIKIENQFARKPFDDDKKLIGDERIREITDPYRGPELPASAPETSRTNIGKVRQLFEERRKQIRRPLPTALITSRATVIGRDKSYPLQPIRRTKPELLRDENNIEKESEITRPIIYDCSIFGKLPNLGGRLLSEKKSVESEAMKSSFSRGAELSASSQRTNSSVNKITDGISRLSTRTTNGLKQPTSRQQTLPQQRNAQPIKKPMRPSNTNHVNDARRNVNNHVIDERRHTNNTQDERQNTNNANDDKRSSNQSSPTKTSVNKKPVTNGIQAAATRNKTLPVKKTPPPGMSSCKICSRNFASDRIKFHQEICEKTSKKRRKVFDPVTHRLKGTEAEGMINQIKSSIKAPPPPKKGNWRRQHEEFVNNIRAARMVKQHIAKGGKLSDLPPPPPIDTSDYVQCPHCARKFNEAAAERHVPKCATMRHNKPKSNVPAARTDPSKVTRSKISTTRKR